MTRQLAVIVVNYGSHGLLDAIWCRWISLPTGGGGCRRQLHLGAGTDRSIPTWDGSMVGGLC